jgi:Ca2+-binding EF-hand superfamily protein
MKKRGVMPMLFFGVLSLLFGCDYDQKDYRSYNSWDSDGNYIIDSKEFSSVYPESGLLNAWDSDSNQRISREEFTHSSYTLWDADSDGFIDVNEWSAATSFYLTEEDYRNRGKYSKWDTDADSLMKDTEFVTFSNSLGYFEKLDLDRDGELSRPEFSKLLFKIYDIDGDGVLRENEFSAFNEADIHRDSN